MREIRSSGSVEGVMRNHDPYSDFREHPARGVSSDSVPRIPLPTSLPVETGPVWATTLYLLPGRRARG